MIHSSGLTLRVQATMNEKYKFLATGGRITPRNGFKQLPPEILRLIFRYSYLPSSFLDSSLTRGPNSPWCRYEPNYQLWEHAKPGGKLAREFCTRFVLFSYRIFSPIMLTCTLGGGPPPHRSNTGARPHPWDSRGWFRAFCQRHYGQLFPMPCFWRHLLEWRIPYR